MEFKKNVPPGIIAEGTVIVGPHGDTFFGLPKIKALQNSPFDYNLSGKLKYLFLAEGTKLKITVEVVE